jgi:hypothetical protein
MIIFYKTCGNTGLAYRHPVFLGRKQMSDTRKEPRGGSTLVAHGQTIPVGIANFTNLY